MYVRNDMRHMRHPTRPAAAKSSRSRRVLIAALFTALISAGICAAAILAPAPAAAVPLIVLLCVGCPIFAMWEAPLALAVLRADRDSGRAVVKLRKSLDQLPETEHPLGL
jgi:hypothetical protein